MNEFQSSIISILLASKLSMCADDIARKMKPRSNRIAVTSSLRSMEKRGFVGRIAPRNQWANAHWFAIEKNCLTKPAPDASPSGSQSDEL